MSLHKKILMIVSGYKASLSDNLKFYQNDQINIVFELNDFRINDSMSKSIVPLKPTKATLYIETPFGVESIDSSDVSENRVTFFISSRYTQNVGVSNMQIQLTDSDGCQISLPPFSFEVKKNIYEGSVISANIVLKTEDDFILTDENGYIIKIN